MDPFHADPFTALEKETDIAQPFGISPIAKAAEGVSPGQDLKALTDINNVLHQILRPGEKSGGNILTRPAEEILMSGEIRGGCHDAAIAFASLARYCGFPVIMLDSASESFLTASDNSPRSGHAYLKIFVRAGDDDSGRWILVNPELGEAYEADTSPGECLPGKDVPHNEELKRDERGPYLEGGRIEMYEVQNYWDVGFGIDPVNQCLDVFKAQFDGGQNCSEVKFRPIPL